MLKGDEVGLDALIGGKQTNKQRLVVEHSAVLLFWVLCGLNPAGTLAGNTQTPPAPQGFFTFFTEDELDADSLRFRCNDTRVGSGFGGYF